jgi:hypothetical protein
MAKQNIPGNVSSSSSDSHGLLSGLIDSLRHLLMAISSRLHHVQVHRSPMGEIKSNYDIWEKLESHVEQIPVAEKHDEEPRAIRRGTAANPNQDKTSPAMAATTGRDREGLSEHNAQKSVHQHLPHMDEQLQKTTMEHINIAMILAREGDKAGAKLRIGLANSAMHTASRFMSHDEYEAFEKRVEDRLASIIDSGTKEVSGT